MLFASGFAKAKSRFKSFQSPGFFGALLLLSTDSGKAVLSACRVKLVEKAKRLFRGRCTPNVADDKAGRSKLLCIREA